LFAYFFPPFRSLIKGTNVSVFWPGENAAYEGTITEVEGASGARQITVGYADGDFEVHDEMNDSFDEQDWRVVDNEPKEGPQPRSWSWREVPEGARQFMHLHLEKHIESRMKHYLGPKHSRPSKYGSVTLQWDEMTHRFFFDTLDTIEIDSDDQMLRILFPRLGYLPHKGVGRRSNRSAPQDVIRICAKALIRRTKSNTIVYFGYSRFIKQGDGWRRMWVEPERPIGRRVRKIKTIRK
jgi:hypothetical protein